MALGCTCQSVVHVQGVQTLLTGFSDLATDTSCVEDVMSMVSSLQKASQCR